MCKDDDDDEQPLTKKELEELEHLGCQNFPNCDMFGCGPDKDVGHRG